MLLYAINKLSLENLLFMNENQILVLRDNAKTDLLQIKSLEEGITYLNQVNLAAEWSRAVKKDTELFNILSEQRLRTQRLLGNILREVEKNKGAAGTGSNQYKEVRSEGSTAPKLSDLGLTKNQSADYQKIASIPEDKWEGFIAEKKQAVDKAVKEFTVAGAVRLATGRTYEEQNRLVAYVNKKYAVLVRAYAHDKNMDISDTVGLMCRTFIDGLGSIDQSRMRDIYLRDLSIGEAK